MLGDKLTGKFFVENNLSEHKYLDVIQQQIVLEMSLLSGEKSSEIRFQRDHCSAHNSRILQEYWNRTFPKQL